MIVSKHFNSILYYIDSSELYVDTQENSHIIELLPNPYPIVLDFIALLISKSVE